jgi:phosphoglycolate phosphatase
MPSRLVDLVVFDLDGTLVDSLRDLCESANELASGYGGRPLELEQVARMVGEGVGVLVERILAATGIAIDPAEALARYVGIYDRRLLCHTRPYPGITELVAGLFQSIPLAVLTNKPTAAAVKALEGLGLARYFRDIVGGDGPLARKPDPGGLEQIVRAAGASSSRTLLVGDSGVDLRTARNAACRFCWARYGFGSLRFPVEELGPDDSVIDGPSELWGVIDR